MKLAEERRTAPTAAPVIRTEALTKVYPGNIRAVDSLDLAVRRGEIFGLLGPNGAGKTTTVGMLTTRVIPTSGKVFIADVDVVAHPTAAKQVIGVVSQQNTLDRGVDVRANLYFHGRYFGMKAHAARRAADEALERFRLADRADADVGTLSGGMAQRLMVARAIMHRPPILFLDEPTAGLDPQSRLALWDILRALNARGQTILLTTHYMEEADNLCDRVAVMDRGRLLAIDAPTALKRSVGADTVVTLSAEGDLDALARRLGSLEDTTGVHTGDGVVRVHLRGTTGILPRVVACAEGGGATITDVSITVPTLETVFLTLTGKELRD